jgi:hypothetical protein
MEYNTLSFDGFSPPRISGGGPPLFKAEIQIAKADTIRWIGGMLVVQTIVIAALVKLL